MSDTKHTPGPWHTGGANLISIYGGACSRQLAVITDRDGATPTDKANAKLIASAPELLQALEDFLAMAQAYQWNELPECRGNLLEDAKNIIAKAKGLS